MIRRLSLSQRLALVVVSLLMLCAVAVCAVQLHSSAQYGNAMVQRLSSTLGLKVISRSNSDFRVCRLTSPWASSNGSRATIC